MLKTTQNNPKRNIPIYIYSYISQRGSAYISQRTCARTVLTNKFRTSCAQTTEHGSQTQLIKTIDESCWIIFWIFFLFFYQLSNKNVRTKVKGTI